MNIRNSQKTQGEKLIFFNEAVEYMKKYDDIDENRIDTRESNRSSEERNNLSAHNCLRNEMLEELNRLKELILKNPDKKLNNMSEEEKKLFNKFIKRYSCCPICGNYNHYYNLKSLYFDEKLSDFKEFLLRNMQNENQNKKLNKFNINIGVLCCSCYKKFYEK